MRINPSENKIRARAFEIYLPRGGQPGHEPDDWLPAKFELTHLPFHVVHLKPLEAKRSRPARRRQRGRMPMRFSHQ